MEAANWSWGSDMGYIIKKDTDGWSVRVGKKMSWILLAVLVLQRDFRVLRDFGYYYETLRLRRFEPGRGDRERVRLR